MPTTTLRLAVTAAEEQPNLLIPSVPDLFWATVCFVVILVVFMWKILPRVRAMLDERADAIEGQIEQAAAAKAEADAALEEYRKQLADARGEAAKIREQARLDGAKILTELKEQASIEVARIMANAQATIEAERQSALVSLRSEVGSLAIDLASGVIGESLSNDKKATAMVDRFLLDLEATDTATSKAVK